MSSRFYKQPGENKDYDFDWTDWMADGDFIASYTLSADDGITLGADSLTGSAVKVFLSGGTHWQDYKVTCRITTVQGRIGESEITILVREF